MSMSEPAGDVSTTIEYSMDKWLIDRVPWALWVCAAGVAVALYADSRGVNGALLAFIYLAVLGLAFAGFAMTTLIARSGISSIADVVLHILIFVVVAAITTIAIAAIGGSTQRGYGSMRWSTIVKPPENVFGWMMIYLGLGWIAFAAYRHFYPARPILMLAPAGISFHRSWLPDLFIPWQDIRGVGPVEPGGRPADNPQVITVLVAKDFFDQHIAPKRRFFAPPGSEYMFWPEGETVHVVLNSAEVAVALADYRIPIEMRWMAFRHQPRSAPPPVGPLATSIVHGRWSIDGSWRQRILFLAPIVAMVAVAVHALGL
jgi:hypothetical protein